MMLIILAVGDSGRSLEFYREVSAWPQIVDATAHTEFELPGGLRLGLYEREGLGRNTGQVAALDT